MSEDAAASTEGAGGSTLALTVLTMDGRSHRVALQNDANVLSLKQEVCLHVVVVRGEHG